METRFHSRAMVSFRSKMQPTLATPSHKHFLPREWPLYQIAVRLPLYHNEVVTMDIKFYRLHGLLQKLSTPYKIWLLCRVHEPKGMEEKCSEVEPIREWTFYPAGFHYGKRCVIDGYIRSNTQTSKEVTLEKLTGSSKMVYNQRGGIPSISKGDKSYLVPEYSSNFHKIGSTRPAINFSRSSNVVCDTFIPLQPLQRKLRQTYAEKNRQCLEEEEKLSVAMLSRWKPTKSLTASL